MPDDMAGGLPPEKALLDVEETRLEEQEEHEVTLEQLEKTLLDVEETRLGPMGQVLLVDVATRTFLRAVFALATLGLFGWMNYQVMNLVQDIFAQTKSLDKEIVMALVGGTVAQLAVITHIMASFLFPSGK